MAFKKTREWKATQLANAEQAFRGTLAALESHIKNEAGFKVIEAHEAQATYLQSKINTLRQELKQWPA